MTGGMIAPDQKAFGKGTMKSVLPWGYIDGIGHHHREVVVKEMTGHIEDRMHDTGLSPSERITEVISGCIERLGDINDKELIRRAVDDRLKEGEGNKPLTCVDRSTLLLLIRRVSVGDVYTPPVEFQKCPKCGHRDATYQVMLDDIDIPKVKHPERRTATIKTPSGLKVKMSVMTANDERRMLKASEVSKSIRSLNLAARVKSIDDKPMPDDILSAESRLSDLRVVDRDFLLRAQEKIERDIDTSIEMQCNSPTCRHEWEGVIDLGQVFFSKPEYDLDEGDIEWED